MFCPACGGSEFERIEREPAPAPGTSALDESQGKVCPNCKTRNETYALLCACGEELGDQAGVPEPAAQRQVQGRAPRLMLVIGAQTLECRHGDVLGREGTLACDLFRAIPTVSGKHISVEVRSEGWFLVNLPLQPGRSDKNITELDGRLLKSGESAPLFGEHVVRMSSRCEVRLRITEA